MVSEKPSIFVNENENDKKEKIIFNVISLILSEK